MLGQGEPLEYGFVTINPRGQFLNPNSRFGIMYAARSSTRRHVQIH